MNSALAVSNRIAAGVTAEYLLDLTRPRPAETPRAGRRSGAIRGRHAAPARLARERDDCGRRHTERVPAVR